MPSARQDRCRGGQPALPHPRTGRPAGFLFTEHGHRPSRARIQRGLKEAVAAAGLTGPDGTPLHVTTHQLRHTYATALANSGMSLQALMTLLGHTSPEMTPRSATLASPALRSAYETAMGRIRPRLPIAPAGKPIIPAIPAQVEWLASPDETSSITELAGALQTHPCAVCRSAMERALPHAVIVVDHFHLVWLANRALARVRQRA